MDMKDIETVCAAYYVPNIEEKRVPQEIMNRQLVRCIADTIIKDMDKMPVKLTVENDEQGETYKMKVNMISDERLRELLAAEDTLFQYKAGKANQGRE
jgi:hypothetical protein